MPSYDELAVRNLWPDFKDDEKLKPYFPSKLPKDRFPSRDYFYTIVNTVYPGYLQELIGGATKKRINEGSSSKGPQAIEVSEEWFKALTALPVISVSNNLKPEMKTNDMI